MIKPFNLPMLAFAQKMLSPVYWIYSKMLFETGAFEKHLGIVIAEFESKEKLDSLFVAKTKEVLDFLAGLDPRRFRRVQSEIKAIVRSKSNQYLGFYIRPPRVCLINFAGLAYGQNEDLSKKLYACTLVHEATHGFLDSKGLLTSRKNRAHKESLCAEEEIRIARKFNDGHEKLWEKLHREKTVAGVLDLEILNKINGTHGPKDAGQLMPQT